MKNKFANVILTFFCLLFLACGGGGEDTAWIPPPAAPENVVSSNANSQAVLSWGKVNGATAYHIYWSTTAGVSKETGTMIPKVSSPYTHTGLINGTTYYYVVTAANQYGESVESKEVSATPSLATPPLPRSMSQPMRVTERLISAGRRVSRRRQPHPTIYTGLSPAV